MLNCNKLLLILVVVVSVQNICWGEESLHLNDHADSGNILKRNPGKIWNSQQKHQTTEQKKDCQMCLFIETGECYFQPFCNLNITRCNIDRISLENISYTDFINNYVLQSKPVILETQNLSKLINNNTGIWNWEQIIKKVVSEKDFNYYLYLEKQGTPKERAATYDIHPLKETLPHIYKGFIFFYFSYIFEFMFCGVVCFVCWVLRKIALFFSTYTHIRT